MRTTLAAIVVATALVLPTTAASGQAEGGSLAEQLIAGAEASLSDGATVAVVRAFDRGYDLVQVLEALIGATLAEDGTAADEEGAPVEPALAPAGVIAGNGTSGSPAGGAARSFGGPTEQIALDALETGVRKTSKKLDKKDDLGARAETYGASLDAFTMIAIIVLADAGYSTEQIILDGLLEGGIDIGLGVIVEETIVIRDRNGDILRPDGSPPTFEDEGTEAAVDGLVDDLLDAITGEDPNAISDNSFKRQYTLTIDVTFADDEGATGTVTGKVNMGELKKTPHFLGGRGTGTLLYENKVGCSLSEGDTTHYPYSVRTAVSIAVFANGKAGGQVTLELAVNQTGAAQVTADGDSFCLDVVRDTADFYTQLISFPDVDVRLRDGQRGGASNKGSGEPFAVDVVVKVKEI